MKKNVLVVLLFCCNVSLFSADTIEIKRLGVGIRHGVGCNFLTNSQSIVTELSSKLSFINTALFCEYRLSSLFSIQPEIQYNGMGFKETYLDTTLTASLNMVGLNLLPKFRFSDDQDINCFYVIAGPSIGYFLNGDVNNSFTKEKTLIDKEKVNEITLSAIFGAGFSHRVGKFDVFSDLRANVSTQKINKIGDNKLLLNQFLLSLGIQYFF